MSEDGEAAVVPNYSQTIVAGGGGGVPTRLSPDDLLAKIDKAGTELQEVATPPTLLARLLDPNAKRRGEALEAARLAQIDARTALIKGMKEHIQVYVDANLEDLKNHRDFYLLPKVYELLDSLYQTVESSAMKMLSEFKRSSDQIASMTLPQEIVARQLESSYKQVEENQASIRAKAKSMIDDVSDKMRRILNS